MEYFIEFGGGTAGKTPQLLWDWLSKKWYLSWLSLLSVFIVIEVGQDASERRRNHNLILILCQSLKLHPLRWPYWLWATKSKGGEGGESWAPPRGERGLQTWEGRKGKEGIHLPEGAVWRKTAQIEANWGKPWTQGRRVALRQTSRLWFWLEGTGCEESIINWKRLGRKFWQSEWKRKKKM